jgi:hypothetical protein
VSPSLLHKFGLTAPLTIENLLAVVNRDDLPDVVNKIIQIPHGHEQQFAIRFRVLTGHQEPTWITHAIAKLKIAHQLLEKTLIEPRSSPQTEAQLRQTGWDSSGHTLRNAKK